MTKVLIDGIPTDPAHATISIFDRGLLFGDGVFDVLRTHRGRPVDLEAHLDRLYASCAALALRPLPRAAIAAAIASVLDPTADERIRIVVTRGPGPLSQPLADLTGGKTIVVVEPLPPQPTSIALAVVDHPVYSGGHKTLAYLDHLRARELARAAGADEAIRLSPTGDAVEGSTSNLFAVLADGTIATPPLTSTGILPGIVRARVLALHPEIREQPISLAALRAARELFVTSSLRGVVPAASLDGVALPHRDVALRIAGRYALCIFADLDG